MTLPTYHELREEFEFIRESAVEGVEGAVRIDSGKPGPTCVVSMLTHGNEPSGLAPLWYFRRNPELQKQLLCGSLLFLAVDIEAAEKAFAASTFEERMDYRCIDLNMNRLPDNILEQTDSPLSEIKRFHQIYPLMKQADTALDIHTTSQDADPMIVEMSEHGRSLLPGLRIPKLLTNPVAVQKGLPLCYFHGGADRDIPIVEIEAGGHEHPSSFDRAIRCTLQVLRNSGQLEQKRAPEKFEFEEYRLVETVWFPSLEYSFVKQFENFEKLKAGQVLAEGDGDPICSPIDGCAFFAPAGGKIHSLDEEAMFISEPPVYRML